MATYYLHPAYHYAHELAYDDDLMAAFAKMKCFREATGTFAEPSAIAGRERVDGEDPMVAWVARATTERGDHELDEEADDPEDPPRPNTFLARAVAEATAEEEGDRGNVGHPYSPRYEMDPEAEVDLLADIQVEEEVVLQMLVVTVVVTVEVEVVTVVRAEEVRVVREEEVAWHSQRSNFFGVQHKIAVMVPHFGTIEGKGFHLTVKEEVNQWIPIVMTVCYQTLRG
ncbi:hypothetical protein Taro_004687 [Colocasia esculenta]|uniref:Uncharacterized protein n=1 Tax=Colocasia esculenta TaxID=4460 RepID=A0A843TQ78_COLES|nr:hypothetical protein [Colocasia esculenta]